MPNLNIKIINKSDVLYFDPFSPNSTYSYKLEGGHSTYGIIKKS